jgi:hypothetical protein
VTVRRFLRDNSLSIVFLSLCVMALVAQAITGHAAFNAEQDQAQAPHISLWRYVFSSSFGVAVMENWQSEYLQFTLFIVLTVWLLQRGSPESKELDKAGGESDKDQRVGEYATPESPSWARVGGIRQAVYENSLLIVMGGIWIGTWLAQSITGVVEFNAQRLASHQPPISWTDYVGNANFWERTLQNWQSEFLAVGSMAILAVYLRQRGSPESKPVGAPHGATGAES